MKKPIDYIRDVTSAINSSSIGNGQLLTTVTEEADTFLLSINGGRGEKYGKFHQEREERILRALGMAGITCSKGGLQQGFFGTTSKKDISIPKNQDDLERNCIFFITDLLPVLETLDKMSRKKLRDSGGFEFYNPVPRKDLGKFMEAFSWISGISPAATITSPSEVGRSGGSPGQAKK